MLRLKFTNSAGVFEYLTHFDMTDGELRGFSASEDSSGALKFFSHALANLVGTQAVKDSIQAANPEEDDYCPLIKYETENYYAQND